MRCPGPAHCVFLTCICRVSNKETGLHRPRLALVQGPYKHAYQDGSERGEIQGQHTYCSNLWGRYAPYLPRHW